MQLRTEKSWHCRHCRMHRYGRLIGIFALAISVSAAWCAEPDPQNTSDNLSEQEAFFEKEIRPLLVSRCFTCHGRQADVKGGLSVASRQTIMSGGDSGPAAVPGHKDDSLLIQAIRYEGLEMPPKQKLPAAEIAKLEQWVSTGLYWPEADAASDVSSSGSIGFTITADDRNFWSFKKIENPAVPQVKNQDWGVTEVDAFILAKLEELGYSPNTMADKRTLLRRATYDLTGLPPTPTEIDAFLQDDSPTAWENVIDRLLASPAYGERWGRHWLDVVRYADTAGDGADYPIREAYKYRDYVIQAFNEDMPYDQFLREQIAGDILAAQNPADRYQEKVIATGYIAVTKRFGYNINKEFHHLDIADTLDTLGRSVLGLSIGCARCHDHKYDPVSTADYYGLYGIFNSSRYSFPGGEEHKKPHDLIPLVPPAEAAKREAQQREAIAQLDQQIKSAQEDHQKLNGDLAEANKTQQNEEELNSLKQKVDTAAKQLNDLQNQRAGLAAQELYEVAYGVREGEPANVKIQHRGEPDNLGEEVPRRFLELLGGDLVPADAKGSGRLQLANWLTRPENPLTARVMMNRIWQYHFRRGIVNSPSDFGLRGERPTHPKLLDYLATRFIDSGWSMKAMHRLLMRSRVYQLSSEQRPEMMTEDPRNAWCWQYSRRRLSAEEMRDTLLMVSGNLDRSPAGPHPFPPVQKWAFTIHKPFFAQYESNHRSVYLMTQRSRKHPYLSLFDGADNNISTAQRLETNTPTQALYLMNDPFVHAQSAGLAARLLTGDLVPEKPGDTEGSGLDEENQRIHIAYETVTGQLPSAEQTAWASEFVSKYAEQLSNLGKSPEEQRLGAWSALARVLMTSNAMLYVD